jgi:hypothetical protein
VSSDLAYEYSHRLGVFQVQGTTGWGGEEYLSGALILLNANLGPGEMGGNGGKLQRKARRHCYSSGNKERRVGAERGTGTRKGRD